MGEFKWGWVMWSDLDVWKIIHSGQNVADGFQSDHLRNEFRKQMQKGC